MTRPSPPLQLKKLLLASVSIAVPTTAGFLSSTSRVGLIIALGFLSMAALPLFLIAVGNYRPKGERWMVLPAFVLFFGSLFPAGIGGHSLWLTAFGETLQCRVDNIERHSSSRGADTFSADLRCGDRKLDFFPTNFRSVRPVGTEMDVVVDRTDFVDSLEPDEVSWWRNLLFLAGLLLNAGFILLVARLPIRSTSPAAEGNRPEPAR